MTEAYITGVGAYLPGDPADNTELAARFGDGSAARHRRALAASEIRTRHYAVDDQGMTVMLNEEPAAHAALRALRDRGLSVSAVRMLATGTAAGDMLVPVSPRWCTDGWAAARWSCCRRPGAAQPRDVRR